MYQGKRILAVVPARGGSRGVPLKNIRPLAGKPLLAYSADIVRKAGIFDSAVVSTDHEGIADVARQHGLEVPFFRTESLSGDFVGDTEVLAHALKEMDRLRGTPFDVVVMLQPTCPLRKASHVISAVTLLHEGGWDAVWSVTRADLKFHPLKQLTMEEDGSMNLVLPEGRKIIARQQLYPTYIRNGAVYAMTRQCLLGQKTTLGRRSTGLVIEDKLVNIDTVDDFARAEQIILEGGGED